MRGEVKHILFFSDNFYPETNAPASRTLEHARQWVAQNRKVTVITSVPNFPVGKPFTGYRNLLWQTEEVDGINVVRVWTYMAENAGFLLRVLDHLSFMVTSFIAALFIRNVDVVIGTSPQFFTVCSAKLYSNLMGKPWVFELRDIWPESIKAVGAMKDGFIFNVLERLELHLYRSANAVVSVTHSFKRELVRRGIDESKIFVITNGVDLSHFSPVPPHSGLVARYQLEEKFVVGYVGTIGMAHGLDTILDAAQLINHKMPGVFKFLLVGDGACRRDLEQRVLIDKIENVQLVGSVSKDQVVRHWALLDVAVVHLASKDLFQTVLPSKIFEAMAMGVPLAHGVDGESAALVNESGAGLCFESENHEELVSILTKLYQAPDQRLEMRAAGLDFAQHYSRKRLATEMLEVLDII